MMRAFSFPQDFHSFDPALNALKNDIKEQNALLEAIMKLEIPATKDHHDLFTECKVGRCVLGWYLRIFRSNFFFVFLFKETKR